MKSKKLKGIIGIAMAGIIISTIVPMKADAEWFQDSENNWSWVENGSKITGWKQIDGNWYYFNIDGKMEEGWVKINGIWYYFDSSGKMQTGWIKGEDSKWYYLNSDGSMKTGWLKTSDGKQYDLGFDGVMKTGWVKETDSNWYYLASSGEMRVGWIQDANGKLYFSSSAGVMQTGIIKVDGKLYAFGENGAILTEGTITYNGKTYKTDASGVIIGYDGSSDQIKQFTKEGVLIPVGTSGAAPQAADTSSSSSNSTGESSSDSSRHHNSSSSSGSSGSSVQAVGVVSVALNKSTDTLNIGDTDTLTATINPANATNKNVSWTSSNQGVVTVDNAGKITAVGAGTAEITCTAEDGNKTASCSVTVNPKIVSVSSVALNKNNDILNVGETDNLTAIINPANATNKNISWTSSNQGIVTVDNAGKISAKGQGTAAIACTTEDGNKTAFCTVTVNDPFPVTSVTLNKSFDYLDFGEIHTLTATVNPANATDKKVSWSSSDDNIIKVDDNGNIKAASTRNGDGGSAKITCTTEDGNKTDSCIVATIKSLGICRVPKNTTYDIESHMDIGCLEKDKLRWRNDDNNNLATVTQDGKVTAGSTLGATQLGCYYADGGNNAEVFVILIYVTD